MSKYKPICIHCRHRIWWDDVDREWHHKSMLHNENCECRNPEPKTIKVRNNKINPSRNSK